MYCLALEFPCLFASVVLLQQNCFCRTFVSASLRRTCLCICVALSAAVSCESVHPDYVCQLILVMFLFLFYYDFHFFCCGTRDLGVGVYVVRALSELAPHVV